jgi:hypothetical protein
LTPALVVGSIPYVSDRILYGSDGADGEYTPQRATAAFRQLALSVSEFEIIENNIAPYMR